MLLSKEASRSAMFTRKMRCYVPSDYLCHYGVKGMKWGVRRTPEELARAREARASEESAATKTVISGHAPTPRRSTANSVMDHVSHTGKVDVRTFYDESGAKVKDIHTGNHGNPKHHNYGTHGEHVVLYEWNEDGSLKNKTRRDLTDQERKENKDIV